MSETVAEQLSILIPTYNRQTFLSICLDSLLLQDCTGYELLVRDNDSVDGTAALCEQYAMKFAQKGVLFRYTKNPKNVGFRDNMVHGLRELSRQFAMILMDDDFLVNTYALSSLYNAISESEQIKLATSPVYQHRTMLSDSSADFFFDDKVNQAPINYQIIDGDSYFLNAWTKYPPLVLSSVIFDRKALLNSDWEQWSRRAALDVNMYNILSLSGDVAVFTEKFVAYRIHDSQDFGNLPLADCYESHQRIANWFSLAKKTGRFSIIALILWRIKTVILKDQGIIKRLYQRNNSDIDTYFSWLKAYNLAHYLIMRSFMPECIRHSRANNGRRGALKKALVDFRRQVLRVFLYLYRKKFDQDYQQSFAKAFRGEK